MAKGGIDGLGIMFGLQLSFIDANELLPFSRLFPEAVVGDSVKPRGKAGFPAEAAKIFVGPQEGFLGEVIGERDVRPNQLAEQTSHARLVIPDQLRKGVMVVINNDTRNEVCIG